MIARPKSHRLGLVALLLLLLETPARGRLFEGESYDLFGDFRSGWEENWMTRNLASRSTRFDVVVDSGKRVLRATSDASASALFRMLEIELRKTVELSWRWKVASSLEGNRNERSKDGDDFAARILLSFGSDTLSRSTRALCYVWAACEPVEAVFRNRRSDNVATIVLESGNEKSGEWVFERRDVIADFRMAFGRFPEAPPGNIAVIVDTDDTRSSAVAWFDDLRIHWDH